MKGRETARRQSEHSSRPLECDTTLCGTAVDQISVCSRQFQCVFDADAKVSDSIFDLAVAKQDLDRSEIANSLIDHRCLCIPQLMGAVIFPSQTDCRAPFINKPRILSCAQVTGGINAAWKHIVAYCSTSPFKQGAQARPDIRGDLELGWATRFCRTTIARVRIA